MNRLDRTRQTQIINALVEGNSIRSTCRMTGVAKGTVLHLLADVGRACAEYQDKTLRNFCRIHQSLRVTPAMEAGVTKRLWSVEDIVKLFPEFNQQVQHLRP